MNDEFDFLIDDEVIVEETERLAWNILIIDDDASVHEATKYALSGFSFMERGIKWFDAYSSAEARELLRENNNMAVLFLDVVMESDHAGLDFARWFRRNSMNNSSRIILRTGQPGQAPERKIIVEYDLHDYKTKTELSSDKLFTTTVAALRAYNDINRLNTTRIGLEGIIKASGNLFHMQTMYEYATNVLTQIGSILDMKSSGIICAQNASNGSWEVLAESGSFVHSRDEILEIISSCNGEDSFGEGSEYMIKMLNEESAGHYAVYLEPVGHLSDIQLQMLTMFCTNISIGISNIKLYNQLTDAHMATVMSLARVTEMRDADTGEHVLRIARGTERLAKELHSRGIYTDIIDNRFLEIIGLASTLHDIGKVSISDAVLLKPGKLTEEEFEIIKTHCEQGAQILQTALDYAGTGVDYLRMGIDIAHYHHERWNGCGYPSGLKGEEIPLSARITSIVDVFDAVMSKRCYKAAFSMDESLQIIRDGRCTFFDPIVTDVFLDIVEELGYE